MNDKMKYNNPAENWFCSLSITEQNDFISQHPFYKNFNISYTLNHEYGIIDLYRYFILNDKT